MPSGAKKRRAAKRKQAEAEAIAVLSKKYDVGVAEVCNDEAKLSEQVETQHVVPIVSSTESSDNNSAKESQIEDLLHAENLLGKTEDSGPSQDKVVVTTDVVSVVESDDNSAKEFQINEVLSGKDETLQEKNENSVASKDKVVVTTNVASDVESDNNSAKESKISEVLSGEDENLQEKNENSDPSQAVPTDNNSVKSYQVNKDDPSQDVFVTTNVAADVESGAKYGDLKESDVVSYPLQGAENDVIVLPTEEVPGAESVIMDMLCRKDGNVQKDGILDVGQKIESMVPEENPKDTYLSEKHLSASVDYKDALIFKLLMLVELVENIEHQVQGVKALVIEQKELIGKAFGAI